MSGDVPDAWRDLPRFAFGDNPALADELAALVVNGRKRATAMTPDDPTRPNVGDRWIVLNGREQPVCVIETVELTARRFNEVDEQFAFDEGEDDRTLASWRHNHETYFRRNGGFAPDMELLCERFRVLDVFTKGDSDA